jgi:hypothetical protein
MIRYHDEEWGVPVHDDRRLFEFLILEGAQAGLSWETVLRKRERYREVFDEFDAAKIARYGASLEDRLGNFERASVSRRATRIRQLRYLPPAIHGREDEAARTPRTEGCPCTDGGVRRHEQGSNAARISICRLDDLLCLYAGHRHGERSHEKLFLFRESR